MGSLGVVSADSAAKDTTTCLSHSWTYATTSTAMRCYYCNGKVGGSATANSMFFDAFTAPVRVSRKVADMSVLTMEPDATMRLVLPATETNSLLAVAAVTACGGPTSL
jgi:hypothetical protein